MKKEAWAEYKEMRHNIAEINPNRGSGPERTKGYYGEIINATENNLNRIKEGQKARVKVIDDNGVADSIIIYENGQAGRKIQDKVGYTNSQIKRFIESGKYDGMILHLNKDHPLLQDEKKLNEFKELAKHHSIKIESSYVSEKEVRRLAGATLVESKIRGNLGLDETKAPVVASGFVANKMISDRVEETGSWIENETEKFMSINQSGIDEVISSAKFAAALSVTKNTLSVIRGEEDIRDAVKDVLIDTASASALAYVTVDIVDKLQLGNDEAALLVNGTIQISKQIIAYVEGEVDGAQLIENVAETTVYLVAAYAGKMIGGAIGSAAGPLGEMIGAYIGEVITTAVCSEVIRTIKFNKEFEKQNNCVKSLYRNAEREIRNSQARLEQLIQRENDELKSAIRFGFENMVNGIQNNSYEQVERGIFVIGKKFGLTEDDIRKDKIVRDTLFRNDEEIILE